MPPESLQSLAGAGSNPILAELEKFAAASPPRAFPLCSVWHCTMTALSPLLRPVMVRVPTRLARLYRRSFHLNLLLIGGESRVRMLLVIAHVDKDADGTLDEYEIARHDEEEKQIVDSATSVVANIGIVASLLFGGNFLTAIGRPAPLSASPEYAAATPHARGPPTRRPPCPCTHDLC